MKNIYRFAISKTTKKQKINDILYCLEFWKFSVNIMTISYLYRISLTFFSLVLNGYPVASTVDSRSSVAVCFFFFIPHAYFIRFHLTFLCQLSFTPVFTVFFFKFFLLVFVNDFFFNLNSKNNLFYFSLKIKTKY